MNNLGNVNCILIQGIVFNLNDYTIQKVMIKMTSKNTYLYSIEWDLDYNDMPLNSLNF